MATQTIEFRSPPSQTVTLRLFVQGSDTQVASATATEATNRKGTYTAAFTDVAAGEYQIIATIGTSPIVSVASGFVTLTLATATFYAYAKVELITTPPTAATIADAVWDEAYSGHTTAGTFGKLMDTLRKSNNVIEGTILASPTPTTTVFKISGADYPTGALEHAILWMSTGTSAEQNSPILTTVNNGDGTLTVTLEEALVTAPVAGDVVLIDPTSHVHAIADIVSAVWSAASSAYSAATGTMGLVMYAFSQMIENVSGWRWKEKALEEAPTAAGGDGIYAITLVAASTGGNVPGTTFSIVGTVTNVTTNSGGTATLNLNAGTYTLRTTTPPGYQSVADSSLVVSADATVTKTLVATSYTPTVAPGCTVTIPVRSQYTTALAGVDVRIKFIGWETGATKPATILSPPPIQTSDANGLVSVILYRQARYTATYTVEGDTTKVVAFTTPNAGSYVVIEG